MPSTYSPSLKLELIGTGEQAGTWGVTTNNNLGTLLEQAITGVVTLNMGDATYTMTNYNGLPDEARNAVLMLNGPITSPQALIMPPQEKVYIVRNRTGNTVTLSANVGGVNVSIANAASEVIFCDGSNVYSATQFNYIEGDLTVTGNVSVGNQLVVANGATIGGNIYGNASTDQWWLPTGNTAARTSSPINGLIRYNSEAQFYEGYANGTWVRFLVANQGAYTITYVAVGGGGGAVDDGDGSGHQNSGGGGGGQVLASTTPAIPGTTVLTITIGAGGAGGSAGTSTTITGIAGAVGGSRNGTDRTGKGGTSGNGNAGGNGVGDGGGNTGTAGGGGGGNGAVGGSASSGGAGLFYGGNGGAGSETLITGVSQYFGGGGGGGGYTSNGSGGTGGGGAGRNNGSTNTGGGAGGAYGQGASANGGSGVVFLSMPTIYYTGTFTGSPTVTTSGSNTILKYTGSGSYTA